MRERDRAATSSSREMTIIYFPMKQEHARVDRQSSMLRRNEISQRRSENIPSQRIVNKRRFVDADRWPSATSSIIYTRDRSSARRMRRLYRSRDNERAICKLSLGVIRSALGSSPIREGRQISRSMRRVKGCVPLADAQPEEFLSLRR